MNKMFTQPTGPVAKQTNKQAIARMLGIAVSAVGYINKHSPVNGYTVLYDPITETCWFTGNATGTPVAWSVSSDSLILTTDVGQFTLTKAQPGGWLADALSSLTGTSLIGGLNYVTPQMYGAKGDGVTDDTAAILLAANAAISKKWPLVFPAGNYIGNTLSIDKSVSIQLNQNANLQFSVIVKGEYFSTTRTVNSDAAWSDIPAGTTVLSGDFSGFNVGDTVVVRLNDTDGGSASQGNEIGSDIATVAAASSSSLTLSSGLRYPYQKPVISILKSAVKYTGTLSSDGYTIPGDYTALFAVNDLLRIENTDGTDGVEAKSAYFEVVRVKSITSTSIVLDKQLEFTHVNPWIAKVGYIENVSIVGAGYIKRLEIRQSAGVKVDGVTIGRSVNSFLYNFHFTNNNVLGAYEPSSMNTTYVFGHSIIDSVTLSGSSSTTDNAVFKVMSSPGLVIGKISSKDANATGSQGNYGFYVDAIFTPYYVPNRNMVIQGIRVEPSRSTVLRSIWLYGLRDSVVDGLIGGQTFLQGCSTTVFSGISIAKYAIELRDLVGCIVTAVCKSGLKLGGSDSTYNITCTGVGTGSSINIAFRTGAGTTNPVTGAAQTIGSNNLYNINGLSTSTDAITMQLSQEDYPIVGAGCMDRPTVSQSVVLSSNVTNPCMQGNQLRKTMSAGSGWIGSRQKGGTAYVGDYRDGYIILNGYYCWVGSDGYLRLSSNKPTSDNPSGVIVVGPVTKGAAVTPSTGTDPASVAVNALIASLIANKVLASS